MIALGMKHRYFLDNFKYITIKLYKATTLYRALYFWEIIHALDYFTYLFIYIYNIYLHLFIYIYIYIQSTEIKI